MDAYERLLTDRIRELDAESALLKQKLAEHKRSGDSSNTPMLAVQNGHADIQAVTTGPSINGLVREAFEKASNRFQFGFIREYVRSRIPNVNNDSINAAIGRLVRPQVDVVEEGKGNKPATYQKKLT